MIKDKEGPYKVWIDDAIPLSDWTIIGPNKFSESDPNWSRAEAEIIASRYNEIHNQAIRNLSYDQTDQDLP